MKNPLADFAEQAKKTWEGMDQGAKIIAFAYFYCFGGRTGYSLSYAGTRYAPFYPKNLSVEEAGEVVDKLKELGILMNSPVDELKFWFPKIELTKRMKLAQDICLLGEQV